MNQQNPQNVELFFSQYPIRKYSKGQILLYFGEVLHNVYFIESGRVRQYSISDSGNEIVVNIFRKKTCLPVYLVMTDNPNTYIYEAMSNIVVRLAPVDEFYKFFTNSPDAVLDHLKAVYSRTNVGLKRMTYMVASTAYYRVLFELINECRFVEPRKDSSYRLHLHEYEIADCAGLSRETANRVFQKLKEKKLVSISRRSITIKNLEKLKEELGDHI